MAKIPRVPISTRETGWQREDFAEEERIKTEGETSPEYKEIQDLSLRRGRRIKTRLLKKIE